MAAAPGRRGERRLAGTAPGDRLFAADRAAAGRRDQFARLAMAHPVAAAKTAASNRHLNETDDFVPDMFAILLSSRLRRKAETAAAGNFSIVAAGRRGRAFGGLLPGLLRFLASAGSDDRAFMDCAALEAIEADPGSAAFRSVDGVLFSADGTRLVAYPPGRAGRFEIPEGVVEIPAHAFVNCAGLAGVAVPASVRTGPAATRCRRRRRATRRVPPPPSPARRGRGCAAPVRPGCGEFPPGSCGRIRAPPRRIGSRGAPP